MRYIDISVSSVFMFLVCWCFLSLCVHLAFVFIKIIVVTPRRGALSLLTTGGISFSACKFISMAHSGVMSQPAHPGKVQGGCKELLPRLFGSEWGLEGLKYPTDSP
jgi:hypothetical protein